MGRDNHFGKKESSSPKHKQTKQQHSISILLPGVSGVLLEGEAEDGQLLAGDGVEHSADNVVREAVLLVIVHQHNLLLQRNIERKNI